MYKGILVCQRLMNVNTYIFITTICHFDYLPSTPSINVRFTLWSMYACISKNLLLLLHLRNRANATPTACTSQLPRTPSQTFGSTVTSHPFSRLVICRTYLILQALLPYHCTAGSHITIMKSLRYYKHILQKQIPPR